MFGKDEIAAGVKLWTYDGSPVAVEYEITKTEKDGKLFFEYPDSDQQIETVRAATDISVRLDNVLWSEHLLRGLCRVTAWGRLVPAELRWEKLHSRYSILTGDIEVLLDRSSSGRRSQDHPFPHGVVKSGIPFYLPRPVKFGDYSVPYGAEVWSSYVEGMAAVVYPNPADVRDLLLRFELTRDQGDG